MPSWDNGFLVAFSCLSLANPTHHQFNQLNLFAAAKLSVAGLAGT